jgi:hypothetical protein
VRASVPPPEARSLHRSDALDDPDLLPLPEEVAAEIVENLETALERFRRVAVALGRSREAYGARPAARIYRHQITAHFC